MNLRSLFTMDRVWAGYLRAIVAVAIAALVRFSLDPWLAGRATFLFFTAAILFAGLWVLSPIDLIPEFLPIIGPLDDVVIVALALRYAARRVPRDVLLAAWPGKPTPSRLASGGSIAYVAIGSRLSPCRR